MKLRLKKIQKVNKTKSCFLKISKINEPLARLKKREKIQINKIRNKKGDITTENSEIESLETIMNNYMPTIEKPRRNE